MALITYTNIIKNKTNKFEFWIELELIGVESKYYIFKYIFM